LDPLPPTPANIVTACRNYGKNYTNIRAMLNVKNNMHKNIASN